MAEKLNLEGEGNCVPLDKIQDVLKALPYAHECRVMFEFLFITGARIAELDKFLMSQLFPSEEGFYLFWKLGKNQKSHRKEFIPKILVEELVEYRKTNNVPQDRMFGITHDTFRRYFNKEVRPKLPPAWHEKTLHMQRDKFQEEYKLQLKGLRKNFQTLLFAKLLEKWHDAGVALEFTSKRMKHHNKGVTAYHYIVNFDSLKVQQYLNYRPDELLTIGSQTRLLDFTMRN